MDRYCALYSWASQSLKLPSPLPFPLNCLAYGTNNDIAGLRAEYGAQMSRRTLMRHTLSGEEVRHSQSGRRGGLKDVEDHRSIGQVR